MHKKSMSLAIVVLVILTLILIVMTLAYFITSQNINIKALMVSDSIESVYRISRYFDYDMNTIFLRSSQNFSFDDGKSKFIEKFNEELSKYNMTSGNSYTDIISNEFYIEYSPIDENHISLSPDKLVLSVDVTVINKTALSEGLLGIKYNYKKTFEKNLPVVLKNPEKSTPHSYGVDSNGNLYEGEYLK
jgi:hypothetical protein